MNNIYIVIEGGMHFVKNLRLYF